MVLKIGIIGGSGLENPEILKDAREVEIETPFGKPSSPLIVGKIKAKGIDEGIGEGIEIVILSRHGKKHEIPPSQVNYRANIYALKEQGCKFIISTTAVGSLREEIKRGDFVILDQFIDFTKYRKTSFFEKFEFGPLHAPMAEPFSENLRKKLVQACKELNIPVHEKGTVVTIEGPRFSTRAESFMFKNFGADVINMSIAPEAILAREAELEYGTIAMSTDYDCWKTDEEPVTWNIISKITNENAEKVKQVLTKAISYFSKEAQYQEIKNTIRTIPNWPKQGVMFRDITTLLKNKEAMKKVINILYDRYSNRGIEVVVAIESRGFIIGGILADKLNCSFVPIRKKGKLPYETMSQEYELEYGTDVVEIHKDAISPGQKVLLIDDLIATSGTALASCQLIEKLGGKIIECAFIIELPELEGRKKLENNNYHIFSIVKFEGG